MHLERATHSTGPIQAASSPVDQIKDAVLAHREDWERSGRAEIRLHLNPPHLGKVQVHLRNDGDQVTGRLVVAELAAFHLLESHLQGMRQRLEESGLTLGKFEVAWQGGEQAGHRQEPPPAFEPLQPGVPRSPAKVYPVRPESRRGVVDLLA